MKIKLPFENHLLPDRYGKQATELTLGNAVVSFPFSLEEVPDGAKTLAWTFVDYDSIPVCGFAYIHWVVANVPADQHQFEADFSRTNRQHVHGKNSLTSKFLTADYSAIDTYYVGPYPPDKDHEYTLTVYALDAELPVSDGIYMNDLMKAMRGHVLASAETIVIGRA